MNARFRELLAFHIDAQRGMFIDETAHAADGAGVWVFSARESDPSWNLFYVLDPAAALRQKERIAREFAVRGREPVWYLADREAAALPDPWRRFGSDCWMARDADASGAPTPAAAFALRTVETAADADAFNRLYLDVFWEGAPEPGAAVPIGGAPSGGGGFEARHWLAADDDGPVALLSVLARDGLAALYNVGTRPSARGRGLGSALMRAVLAEEARRGVARFFLLTERDKPLAPFYERLGFATVTTGGYYRCS